MAKIDLIVTLVSIGFDDYNNIDSGHFSVALPPSRFPVEVARQILNEQVLSHILNLPKNYTTATNLSRDARGYAFSVIPHSVETREALANLTEGESITVAIEVETPPDFEP